MKNKSKGKSKFDANVKTGGNVSFKTRAPFLIYDVVCRGPDGQIKWREVTRNLITTEGLNDVTSKYFKGSAYTAAHYVGLKGTGSVSAGDTLASHAGWTEITAYTGNRKALTLGTVSGGTVDNSASKASFAINGTANVYGAFLATVSSGTSGVLYSASDFSVNKSVTSGDTIEVTCTVGFADDGA